MKMILIIAAMGFSLNSLYGEGSPMDGEVLQKIIREFSDEKFIVNNNVIEFSYKEVPLYCIYDESHDRMRIISPVKKYSQVTDKEKNSMMEANFHSALDARYASSGGVLYAAYIHPLSPLKEKDVIFGIYQVVSLHLTFGKDYSSGLLSFGNQEAEEKTERI